MAAKTKAREPETKTKLSVRTCPALHKELKLRAVAEDMTLEDKVHLVLCDGLGLKDLRDKLPSTLAAADA